MPRTASIRATSEAVLLVIDRAPFLAAVTGHVVTGDRATSIADDRIESDKRESGRREA